jgi:subtilisin family serine protease
MLSKAHSAACALHLVALSKNLVLSSTSDDGQNGPSFAAVCDSFFQLFPADYDSAASAQGFRSKQKRLWSLTFAPFVG